MAIHNQIILYGKVCGLPVITKDKDGEPIRGRLTLLAAPGQRDELLSKRERNLKKVKYCKLPVLTGNQHLIQMMSQIKENDIVLIKGNLTTRNVIKKTVCPDCKEIHSRNGMLIFVTPIHMSVERTGLSAEEAEELVKEHCEISNVATILGTVASKIQKINPALAKFQLAIDRKYFIADDNPETRTDYPWVSVRGREKVDDLIKRCHPNTVLFIDGIIQTMQDKKKTVTCEKCGKAMPWKDWTIDIYSYAHEYVANWKTDEMLAKEEEEKAKKIREELFQKAE